VQKWLSITSIPVWNWIRVPGSCYLS